MARISLLLLLFMLLFSQRELRAQTTRITEVDQLVDARNYSVADVNAVGGPLVRIPHRAKIDAKDNVIYFNTKWSTFTALLESGQRVSGMGRYRVYDQKFEVKDDDETYELNLSKIRSVIMSSYRFVVLPSQAYTRPGLHLYEVLLDKPSCVRLYRAHFTEWREPKQNNGYNQPSRKRSLVAKEQLYVATEGNFFAIDNVKELLAVASLHKHAAVWKAVRKEHSKLSNQAVALLDRTCDE